MDKSCISTSLNYSYFFLALCRHYNVEITSAKITEDQGALRLHCDFQGSKKDIEILERKNLLYEHYVDEIHKIIQKGPMAPPTFAGWEANTCKLTLDAG